VPGKDWWNGFVERHPEVSLVRDIERLEKMLADAEDGRIRAESARLQESLRLPLANVVDNATTAPTKRRSVGALRAKDGKARLVTSAGLQADLEIGRQGAQARAKLRAAKTKPAAKNGATKKPAAAAKSHKQAEPKAKGKASALAPQATEQPANPEEVAEEDESVNEGDQEDESQDESSDDKEESLDESVAPETNDQDEGNEQGNEDPGSSCRPQHRT